MPSGGEELVAGLVELGVEVAFGLPGVHNLPAWKAFATSPVRLVGVRHEQTAAYAADGWARATGRLGVAVTTTGPGAANAVTGCGEAWAAGSPVLVVATDIPMTLRRPGEYRGVLHETTDQASFFRPVTKAVVRVDRAQDLRAEVVRAGRLAMEHPRRPVYLEVPTDLLRARVAAAPATGPVVVDPPPVPVDEALAALAAAARPLVWAGGGATASGAGGLIAQVALRLGAPVLTSYGGRGLLAPDHPTLVPLPPHVPAAGRLWDEADLVLVVGSDLDFMNTQGFRQPDRPMVVLDLDVERVQTGGSTVVPLRTDAAAGLAALLPGLDPRAPWWDRDEVARGWEAVTAAAPQEVALLRAVEAGLPTGGVLVADMCVAGYWYGGFGRVSAPGGLAYPVGWGTLGFGFPAAIGAALSGRPTVALVGDGGFLFACGELATVAQERVPLVTVLVDDGGYGMLAYDFTKDGEQPVGCELEPPDFVALATAFRVGSREVAVEDLAAAVCDGLAAGTPLLLVVRASLTPPPTTSPRWYRAHG